MGHAPHVTIQDVNVEEGRVFPKPAINLEERDVIPAPVKVSTIFTCAKCESALLALWRSLLAAGPQPLKKKKK